jgi:hypothetical protein
MMPPRSYRRAALYLVCFAAVFVGCGSGQVDNTPEQLREQQELIRSELLLNEAELIRAELHESEEHLPPGSRGLERAQSTAIRRIESLSKDCAIGDGLEPCSEREEIEAIVQGLPPTR